jgi:hypothetical protein
MSCANVLRGAGELVSGAAADQAPETNPVGLAAPITADASATVSGMAGTSKTTLAVKRALDVPKKSAHPARAISGVLLHRSLLVTSAREAKSS